MDAFFAAVEILDNPSLRGRPVIVGGRWRARDREHGQLRGPALRDPQRDAHGPGGSAVPSRDLPPARGDRYAAVSRDIFAALEEFTPLVEPVSIDEAFLDLTGTERLCGSPVEAARAIKARVREATGGLTSSVGIASSKFVAKVASDLEKPDGLVQVPSGREIEFLAPLPVEKIWGVVPGPPRSSTPAACGGSPTSRPCRPACWPPPSAGRPPSTSSVWPAASIPGRSSGAGSPLGLQRDHLPGVHPAGDLAAVDRALLALAEDTGSRLRAIGARARRVT